MCLRNGISASISILRSLTAKSQDLQTLRRSSLKKNHAMETHPSQRRSHTSALLSATGSRWNIAGSTIRNFSLSFVFTSRNQKLVKVVRHEHNECQLYIQKFDGNVSFIRLKFIDSKPVYELEWKYVVALLSCPAITKLDHLCED